MTTRIDFNLNFTPHPSTGSKNPWIHLSLTEGSNRYQTLTLWNHKTYSTGLVDLSGS